MIGSEAIIGSSTMNVQQVSLTSKSLSGIISTSTPIDLTNTQVEIINDRTKMSFTWSYTTADSGVCTYVWMYVCIP